MANNLYDRAAGKRSATVTVNGDLLRQAEDLGLDLSMIVEDRLVQIIRAERQRRWLEENQKAFKAFNAYFERHGSFADDYRTF